MKTAKGATSVLASVLVLAGAHLALAQRSTEVRRAQPVEETPQVRRALPVDAPTPTPSPRKIVAPPPEPEPVRRAPPTDDTSSSPETPPPSETEAPDQRQLNYANALFGRKLYDLAVPEYEKFLGQYPGASGRASAYFYLGECYRSLNKTAAARTSFQSVLDEYGESEFAGPAAYGVAEILFNQKDYAGANTLFHRSAGKSKEAALALSARYFEARCLENLDRKEDAANLYLQVVEAKNPNPFREDARLAAGSILVARGRKTDAFKQYEALANETGKPALKAEATVRAGLVAVDLQQGEKGKPDKAMLEKATALLQKGRALPEAGRWRGIAETGLLRLFYLSGQYAPLLAEYKRGQEEVPEDSRAEIMLLAANSERQLGHDKEAEAIYAQIIAKYPNREEAKDARYQRLINIYNSDPTALVPAVDQFLASNPTAERADQAQAAEGGSLLQTRKLRRRGPDLRTTARIAALAEVARGIAPTNSAGVACS